MIENNIYTESLKFGIDNIQTGVTYNELINHLKSLNKPFQPEFQRYLHIWFYENFYVDVIYQKIKDFNWGSGDLNENNLSKYDNEKGIIIGSAHQTYLDHQELKFAYKAAKKATESANIAIWVTAIVGLIQIVISLYQNCNNIVPN